MWDGQRLGTKEKRNERVREKGTKGEADGDKERKKEKDFLPGRRSQPKRRAGEVMGDGWRETVEMMITDDSVSCAGD